MMKTQPWWLLLPVSINGTYPNQRLLGFMLVAVPENAVDETTAMGTFQVRGLKRSETEQRNNRLFPIEVSRECVMYARFWNQLRTFALNPISQHGSRVLPGVVFSLFYAMGWNSSKFNACWECRYKMSWAKMIFLSQRTPAMYTAVVWEIQSQTSGVWVCTDWYLAKSFRCVGGLVGLHEFIPDARFTPSIL